MFCEPTILIKQMATWGLGRVKGCLVLGKKKKSPKIADKIKSRMACGCR